MISFEFWHTHKHGILRRFAISCVAAVIIGLMIWAQHKFAYALHIQMAYSFAITLLIWFFSDVGRLALFHRDGVTHLPSARVHWIFSTCSIVLGYLIGTLIGDAYSGFSTFELIQYDLNRFAQYLITAIFISLGFMGYFYQKERLATAHKQQAESHLKLLQSQLEPHMLFNTLANLRALIQTDSDKALSMLDALNNYLRATLSGSRAQSHPLSDEFARLNDYLALMSVRMGKRLRVTLDCPASLAALPVPTLILQPLVENAIKHGIEPSVHGGEIYIQAAIQDKHLLLTVSDTGLGGLPFGPVASNAGFGLSHVQERLQNTYADHAQLSVVQHDGYASCLQISLPVGSLI